MTVSLHHAKLVSKQFYNDLTRIGPVLDPLPEIDGVFGKDTPYTRGLAGLVLESLKDFRILAGSVSIIAAGGGTGAVNQD